MSAKRVGLTRVRRIESHAGARSEPKGPAGNESILSVLRKATSWSRTPVMSDPLGRGEEGAGGVLAAAGGKSAP